MTFTSRGVRALVLLQMDEMDRLFAVWRKAKRLGVGMHMAWMPSRVLASRTIHTARWGAPMTVEAMLEHAVAHPMRHRLQLEELVAKSRRRR